MDVVRGRDVVLHGFDSGGVRRIRRGGRRDRGVVQLEGVYGLDESKERSGQVGRRQECLVETVSKYKRRGEEMEEENVWRRRGRSTTAL